MRRVARRRVRTFVRAAIVLLLLASTGPASADVGVGLIVQASRYADQPNRNIGGSVELSIDRERWQYFTELGVLAVSFGPSIRDGRAGTMWRGGVGARYLAREFELGRVDFVLGFEVVAAIQDLRWSNGDHDIRPELGAGFVWSFVMLDQIASRTSVRAFFTPSPTGAVACRGPCPAAESTTSGFLVITGVSW